MRGSQATQHKEGGERGQSFSGSKVHSSALISDRKKIQKGLNMSNAKVMPLAYLTALNF